MDEERINLETAVGPRQKVQDFDSESLTIRVEHSQKVKAATTSVSDYGSKDCAFCPDPTAASSINTKLLNTVKAAAHGAIEATHFLSSPIALCFMSDVARLLAKAFLAEHKVVVAGNGGSLCDAAHFAEELTGCFRKPRRALPAIVLSEPGHLTCVGNDFGFDDVYRRGIEAFGQRGDVFVALTTSGLSSNIILAVEEAKRREMKTVCFLGKGGGALLDVADYQLIVPKASTSDRIQEVHMACLHIIIEGVEALLFDPDGKTSNASASFSATYM
jgi:D-sedoheptulose 7-phosphate isomerase